MSSRQAFARRPHLPAGGFADGSGSLASQAVTTPCPPQSPEPQQDAEHLLPNPELCREGSTPSPPLV